MFIAARRRESQTWAIVGTCPWHPVSKLKSGNARFSRNPYRKVSEQRNLYEWERPEHKSCFWDAHKVIEAKDKEEALKLCQV